MSDPAAHRIETLVHDLIMKRLLDGQFDDCDLTFGELELIEKVVLVKTVLSIHHGRLPYPSEKPGGQAAGGRQIGVGLWKHTIAGERLRHVAKRPWRNQTRSN